MERLYLCHAWSRTLFGGTNYNPPSRFLSEIPDDMLRPLEKDEGDEEAVTAAYEGIPVNPGDTVVHDRWGEGVVLAVSGRGSDAQARVAFEEVGEKQLILAYAPIRPAGG
jgi:DNA helicase-2/ATP-dependent DNA helicase PcrA